MNIEWIKVSSALILLTAYLMAGCATSTNTPISGDTTRLPAPELSSEREYLGLSDNADAFFLTNLKAEIMIVHVFDMYCHVCQDSAENVNGLFELIQERGYGNRIKMIGLGAGNTLLEVETYRKKFKVPFPLVPDRSKTVSEQFGLVRTPSINALKNEHGVRIQFFRHLGYVEKPKTMLDRILKALGNNPEAVNSQRADSNPLT